MVKERLTTRDAAGNPILKCYAVDAQMAAVRKLAEYEEAEEEAKKKRQASRRTKAAGEKTERQQA